MPRAPAGPLWRWTCWSRSAHRWRTSATLFMLNTGEVGADDFTGDASNTQLTDAGRKKALAALERRMDEQFAEDGRRVSYRDRDGPSGAFAGAGIPHRFCRETRPAGTAVNEQRVYLVSYDIAYPRRWRRVFKLMKKDRGACAAFGVPMPAESPLRMGRLQAGCRADRSGGKTGCWWWSLAIPRKRRTGCAARRRWPACYRRRPWWCSDTLAAAWRDRGARELHQAWHRVRANRGGAGGDSVTVGAFARRLERETRMRCARDRRGRYRPGPFAASPSRSRRWRANAGNSVRARPRRAERGAARAAAAAGAAAEPEPASAIVRHAALPRRWTRCVARTPRRTGLDTGSGHRALF